MQRNPNRKVEKLSKLQSVSREHDFKKKLKKPKVRDDPANLRVGRSPLATTLPGFVKHMHRRSWHASDGCNFIYAFTLNNALRQGRP